MSSQPNWVKEELSFGDRLGLTFIGLAASLSATSVIIFGLYLAYTSIRNSRYGTNGRWNYSLTAHVNIYFLGLLVADFFQALGSILNFKWVNTGVVKIGPYCTAQGAIKQIGNVTVPLTTLAIAVDTFAVLFCRWHPGRKYFFIPILVLTVIWVFVALVVGVGYAVNRTASTGKPYFGIAGHWCWITDEFEGERFGLEYCYMWGCALLNFLLYIPLFFKLRGNIIVNGRSIEFRKLGGAQAWTRSDDPHGNLNLHVKCFGILWFTLPLSFLSQSLAGRNSPGAQMKTDFRHLPQLHLVPASSIYQGSLTSSSLRLHVQLYVQPKHNAIRQQIHLSVD